MANVSLGSSPGQIIYVLVGSVDHVVGVPTNCWALWLIISGTRTLIEAELLTLNLIVMETACSVCFFLSLIQRYCNGFLVTNLLSFYHVVAIMGRALFQCHICVDRYLAVVHPVAFIRYKQMRYRGSCLAAVWLPVLCCGLVNVFITTNASTFSICSFCLLAPILFIELFCSLRIVRILRSPGPGSKEAVEKKEGNWQKRRAVRIICLMLVMLLFNVVPYIVTPFFLVVAQAELLAIAFTLSTAGGSVQAFLFLSRSGKLPCKSKN